MPVLGERSLGNLSKCHPDLQRVVREAIKTFDFSIICGYRGREEQEKAFAEKKSNAHFGQSPHNFLPSLAFDAVPYPLNWNDFRAFEAMANNFIEAAARCTPPVKITWGADWNENGRTDDEKFRDYPHFQIHDWKEQRLIG